MPRLRERNAVHNFLAEFLKEEGRGTYTSEPMTWKVFLETVKKNLVCLLFWVSISLQLLLLEISCRNAYAIDKYVNMFN